MLALTAQQEKLWRYLKSCERCPSFDEMAVACGITSKSAVHRLVCALEAKGYVGRVGGAAGGYRMARALVVHDSPQVDLSQASTAELWGELACRGEIVMAA